MFSHIKELFTRPSGYTIGKSVRLRSSAQGYLSKTLTTPTNNKKWTYSVWMKRGSLSANRTIMSSNVDGAEYWDMRFNTSDQIYIQNRVGSSNLLLANTTAVYRDPSAWYHIVFVFDSANATAANRNLLYVNGVNVSLSANSASSDASAWNTSGVQHNIGVSRTLTSGGAIWAEYDGYLTEINFIDGQALTPSSFGETDSITGVWKAKKYSGTYGTNGFYLNFSDNSSNTATTIGKDYSGNGNNWTPNNISVTSGVTYDSMVDSPTVSAVSSNYAVLNPIVPTGAAVISGGNLNIISAGTYCNGLSTINLDSGAYYAECVVTTHSAEAWGIWDITKTAAANTGTIPSGFYGIYSGGATLMSNGTSVTTNAAGTPANGDIVQVAWSNGKVWFGKNNTWYDSAFGTTGNPSAGTNATFTGLTVNQFAFIFGAGNATVSLSANFGQRPFSYTPPTGYVALNTWNLPDSTIKNGAAYMAATTYTGNGTSLSINNAVNGVSFQPDLVWIKSRSNAYNHELYDSVRGVQKRLLSNLTNAESTSTLALTAFNSNGFTQGGETETGANGATYVAWNWKAGGTSSSNTNGSITSTVSVGATQGFSVVQFTATGSNATVGHGLGVAPAMVIVKDAASAGNWAMYHQSLPSAAYYLYMNTTAAQGNASNIWNSTAPTSTVFSVGTWHTADRQIAYCFAAVAGYSAFGSYTGNGSTDGPFLYTGFRPRFFMYKRTDSAGSWVILDSSRNPSNVTTQYLYPNAADAEVAAVFVDFVSNGVKFRTTYTDTNGSGFSYIYACFAESPFKTSLAR